MLKVLNEFKALGHMALSTFILHARSMRIGMTHLTIGIFVTGRHVLKNMIDVARKAGDLTMLARERKIGVLVMIKLNPRKVCRHMTKATAFIYLSLGVNITMTVRTLSGG